MLRALAHNHRIGEFNAAAAVAAAQRWFAVSTIQPSRVLHFVPSLRTNMHAGLSALGADLLVADLEDAVKLEDKALARTAILSSVESGHFQCAPFFVRVNSLDNLGELEQDILQMTHERVHGFVIPKVNCAKDLLTIESMVRDAEAAVGLNNHIKFIPIVETPLGLLNVGDIAKMHRNVAIIGGYAHDYATATQSTLCDDTVATARSLVVAAARAYSIEPIDGPWTKIDDNAGFMRSCRVSKQFGFSGRVTLTSTQVRNAQSAYSVSAKDVHWAEHVLNAHQNGSMIMQASDQTSREFVGPPHIDKANTLLKLSTHSSLDRSTVDGSSFRHGVRHIDGAAATGAAATVRAVSPAYGIRDWRTVSIGTIVHSDAEVTITPQWNTIWQSAFFTSALTSSSAIAASTLLNRSEKTCEIVPISLLATLALAMSVPKLTESARVHLGAFGICNAVPVMVGDTLRNSFEVQDIWRNSHGNVVADTVHVLSNQRGERVFQLGKRTMFPAAVQLRGDQMPQRNDVSPMMSVRPLLRESWTSYFPTYSSMLVNINKRYHGEQRPLPSVGSLIAHRIVKVFDTSDTLALCNLMRLTNAHHLDKEKFSQSEILVPGPLVLAAALSNVAQDLGDILHETWCHATNINVVNHGDQISSVTFVVGASHVPGDQTKLGQVLETQTFGFKNIDHGSLLALDFPAGMFSSKSPLKPKQYESIFGRHLPELQHNLVCQVSRTVLCWHPAFTHSQAVDQIAEMNGPMP
jgi:citrate lyase subunit beta / citryl-CoA lyase